MTGDRQHGPVVMTAVQLHAFAASQLGRDLIGRRRLRLRELAGRYPYRVHPGPAWFVRDQDSAQAFTLTNVRASETTSDVFPMYADDTDQPEAATVILNRDGDRSAVFLTRPGAARYAVTASTSGEQTRLRDWLRDTTDGREVPWS